MGYKVIAPVGDNLKALFIGMREFPTEKVILIVPEKNFEAAKGLSKKLEEFAIRSEIIELDGDLMEGMFRAFGKVCALYNQDELIVNVATGDRMSTCAALSAAFANGLMAIGVMDDKPMLLPIMKLSYYHEISNNKLNILRKLSAANYLPLKDLCKKLGMSIALVSYHINGNRSCKGLKEYRLVDVKEEGNKVLVRLSELGRLLIKGYLKQKDM